MRKRKRIKLAAAVLCTAALATVGGGVTQAADQMLKVGVREAIPGFGYKNETSGTYSGMEVDMARKLADELGYDGAEFISVTAQTREEALTSGEVDCVIATFSVTDERKENFSFSEAYYEDSLRILTEKSSLITEPEDLKDATVAVAKGSTAALAMAQSLADLGVIDAFDEADFETDQFHDGVSFIEYDNYPDMETALESGEVDAMCADGSILSGYLTDERVMLELSFSPQEYAVATAKDSDLTAKIGDVIAKWNGDGTLTELREKWDLA